MWLHISVMKEIIYLVRSLYATHDWHIYVHDDECKEVFAFLLDLSNCSVTIVCCEDVEILFESSFQAHE